MTVLCSLSELSTAGILEAFAGEESLIVLWLDGEVRAYRNICPHAGRALNWAPNRFLYQHGQLVCAAHGAAFQPEDGLAIGGPCKGQHLRAVEIEVSADVVVLKQALD